MKHLIYVKDMDRLAFLVRRHKDLLTRENGILTPCPHVWHATRTQCAAQSIWAGDFISTADTVELDGIETGLRDDAFEQIGANLSYEGINLAELVRLEQTRFFRQALRCHLIAARALDRFRPGSIALLGEEQTTCWARDRATQNNSILPAQLQYAAHLRGLTIHKLDYTPTVAAQDGPAEEDDSGRIFVFDCWRKPGARRLVALGGGFHLHILRPTVDAWNAREGCEGILLNLGKTVPRPARYRAGMADESPLRYASVADLSLWCADPRLQQVQKTLEETLRQWQQARSRMPQPQVMNNPWLDFQWSLVWNNIAQVPLQLQRAREAMRVLRPDVLLIDEMAHAQTRIYAEVARKMDVATAECPHGYVGDIEEFEPRGELFLAWGEQSVHQLRSRFPGRDAKIVVTGSPVTERAVAKAASVDRCEVLHAVGLDPKKKTVCIVTTSIFANVAPLAMKAFQQHLEAIDSLASQPGVQVLFKVCPRADHADFYRQRYAAHGNVAVCTDVSLEELSGAVDAAVLLYYLGTGGLILMHADVPAVVVPNPTAPYMTDAPWKEFVSAEPLDRQCLTLLNDMPLRRRQVERQRVFARQQLSITQKPAAERSAAAIGDHLQQRIIQPNPQPFPTETPENAAPTGSQPRLAICLPRVGAVSETFMTRMIHHLAPGRTVLVTGAAEADIGFRGPVLGVPYSTGASVFHHQVEEQFVRFIRENRITHILCQYACYGADIIEVNRRRLHLPIFVHFHGGDGSALLHDAAMLRYYRWMADHVTGIIAVSTVMKERLVAIGIPEHKILVRPCGTEVSADLEADPLRQPCRFVAVMRLVGKKAPLLLLQAFRRVLDHIPDCTLDIVGDGPLRPATEEFIAANGLSDSVRLHGAQPYTYTRQIQKTASACVLHSITDPDSGDAEGLPVCLLEASALGLPIVSTHHEGIPEAVEHGRTGFLVRERDVKAMAEYMVQLAKDPRLRVTMGKAGREKMQKQFAIEPWMGELRKFIFKQPRSDAPCRPASASLGRSPSRRALLASPAGSLHAQQGTVSAAVSLAYDALERLGYCVEVVECEPKRALAGSGYDLFAGFAGASWECIRRQLPDSATRICLTLDSHWRQINMAILRQLRDLREQTGKSPAARDQLRPSEQFALDDADGILCLGGRQASRTYTEEAPVFAVDLAVQASDPPTDVRNPRDETEQLAQAVQAIVTRRTQTRASKRQLAKAVLGDPAAYCTRYADRPGPLLWGAEQMLAAGQQDAAADLLRAALTAEPKCITAMTELAAYYAGKQDLEQAREWIAMAVGIAPSDHRACAIADQLFPTHRQECVASVAGAPARPIVTVAQTASQAASSARVPVMAATAAQETPVARGTGSAPPARPHTRAHQDGAPSDSTTPAMNPELFEPEPPVVQEARRIIRTYAAQRVGRIWGAAEPPVWFDHNLDRDCWPKNLFWVERGVYGRMVMHPGCRVLDLCCGDGYYSDLWYATIAAEIDACDNDPSALRFAQLRHGNPRISYHRLDILRDPLPQPRYDVVAWFDAIEHFSEPQIDAILRKIAAALPPGGVLVGSTPIVATRSRRGNHQHDREFVDAEDLAAVVGSVFPDTETWLSIYPERTVAYFKAVKR